MTTNAGTETATSGTPSPGDAAATAQATQPQSQADPSKVQNGAVASPFGELDADTSEWIGKREIKDVPSLIKVARDKDSMVGKQAEQLAKAIVPPGKDAKPEELQAFREKMGIPAAPDDYDFKAPDKLPEDLPYDGERAAAFKAKAHELGLSKTQAAAVHDWAVENAVGDYDAMAKANDERLVENAKAETAKLVKLYGPVTGETFRAQAAFADKALMEVGGQDALEALQQAKLIGDVEGQKIVQSSAIFNMLAKMGQTLFREGEVLKGDPARLNNPFVEGPAFNLTQAMALVKQDRSLALSFIQAAGKKPEDFGLKA